MHSASVSCETAPRESESHETALSAGAPKQSAPNTKPLILVSGFVMLAVLFVASLCVGAVKISVPELWQIITGAGGTVSDAAGEAASGSIDGAGDGADEQQPAQQPTQQPAQQIPQQSASGSAAAIFLLVRLPRTLAALLAGTALALSGVLLQTVLANPMCSPSIIGVNAGAGLFMIVTAAFFPAAIGFAPVSAFLGAGVAVAVVYAIAKGTGASKLAIVLSGIAVSSLLSAFTDTIVTLVPDAKISRVDFMIGSFSGVTMANVGFAVPYIVVGLAVALVLCVDINVLALGDSTAGSLGLRVGLLRGVLLAVAALLAGAAISLGGLIGFVGLIVPHLAKMLIGHDHKYLLPLTAVLGGAFCLLCDILARVLFVPFEIPVGIIMSLLGSPFFIWLILTRKRRAVLD